MISPWSNPIANFDLRWTTYDIVNIGQCRRGDCSMSSVRDWTTGFAVIGTILLGPIIAFLTVVAAEVLIDFLKERAVIAAADLRAGRATDQSAAAAAGCARSETRSPAAGSPCARPFATPEARG